MEIKDIINKPAYVYIYLDKINSTVYYVGKVNKEKSLKRRIISHKYDNWFNEKLEIYFTILESSAAADMVETALISSLKPLYNKAKMNWGECNRISIKDFGWINYSDIENKTGPKQDIDALTNSYKKIIKEYKKTIKSKEELILKQTHTITELSNKIINKTKEYNTVSTYRTKSEKVGLTYWEVLYFYQQFGLENNINFTSVLYDESGNKIYHYYCDTLNNQIIFSNLLEKDFINFSFYPERNNLIRENPFVTLSLLGLSRTFYPNKDIYGELFDRIGKYPEVKIVSSIYSELQKEPKVITYQLKELQDLLHDKMT